jgi:hypothetical protein
MQKSYTQLLKGVLPLVLAFGAFAADVIPGGTRIAVRTNDQIKLRTNDADGRIYTAVVANDVADTDGRVIIPRGSNAELIARRVGKEELAVDLDSVTVGGRRYAIQASEQDRRGKDGVGANKRTGEFVGGTAVLGTLLGAIAGGGRGAAIGAASGAAVGAGAQVATRGRSVNVPAETLLTFRLEQPIYVDVHDNGHDKDGKHYHDNYDRFDKRQ